MSHTGQSGQSGHTDRAPKTRADLRSFGLTVGTAFLVLAGILWWRQRATAAQVVGGIGAVLVVLGVVAPVALRSVERAWMGLALMLSKVTTPVFMSIVYFVVLAPTGLLRRTIGKHPLRHAEKDESFWSDREGKGRSDLERQF
jgi:hypothetical protein